MPSPKSGTAGSPVAPAGPIEAHEADNADPGEVDELKREQQESGTGKYGEAQTTPHEPDEENESWIEIELIDEEDNPVPGERYRITMPDGETVASGTLDEKGFARVEGIESGTCKVTFPALDQDAWEPA